MRPPLFFVAYAAKYASVESSSPEALYQSGKFRPASSGVSVWKTVSRCAKATGMFLLKQILKVLFLPPTPWLLLLLAAAIFWTRRWARKVLWAAVVVAYVLHSGYVANWLRYPLESRYPPLIDPSRAGPYDAIVVLMAGTTPVGGLIPFPKISETLFNRLDEAWRLYRLRPKPIIVAGGHVNPFTMPENENDTARSYLLLWGAPKERVIAEPNSRDTFENAVEVGKILRQRGWKRYLLVTSATHMPRSMLVFEALAPGAIPAPGDFTAVSQAADLIPSEEAAYKLFASVHEYLGMINYRWRLWREGKG